MAKSNPLISREELVRQQPTIYTFNFKDVPVEKYAEMLDVLFHAPVFCEIIDKRNRFVMSADRLRSGTSEMKNLVKIIQQSDRKLADAVFSSLVQTNLRSNVSYDFLSFTTLLRYYVNYKKDGIKERVDRLACNLDKVTFLADLLESIVTDIKADMNVLFDGKMEFNQFDAVAKVLEQLRGFFNSARSKNETSPETQLYFEYSDSINDYVGKRLKTYTAKYRKMHPAVTTHTEADLIEALKIFFGDNKAFSLEAAHLSGFIGHTEAGGAFIDAAKLYVVLDGVQREKMETVMAKKKLTLKKDNETAYCLTLTDTLLAVYRQSRKKFKKE